MFSINLRFLMFFSISEAHKPLSSRHLQLFCMPLQALNGKEYLNNKDSAFHITSTASRILINELESKPRCIKIITSSINALSKLTSFMDSQVNQMRYFILTHLYFLKTLFYSSILKNSLKVSCMCKLWNHQGI